jgi:hypothetical protein
LKRSESYESGQAGLLVRRAGWDLAPVVLACLRESGTAETSESLALRLGVPAAEVREALELLAQRDELQCEGQGTTVYYSSRERNSAA